MPVLAIDAGTTGITCLVLEGPRDVRGRAYKEFTQHYPRPGWVEHDAAEIWDTVLAVAKAALADAAMPASSLEAIGVTDQRETVVLWDRRTGRPVAPAIVWQDRRTASMCRGMQDAWGDTVRQRTGLVIDPYFSGTKLRWLLDHGAREDAEAGRLAFGTVDSWLAWNLTGGRAHVTDVTNASRTLLYDIHAGAWDAELLEAFAVPEAVLPDVVPSAHECGRTPERLLGAEVAVAALVGDQQAALFGQACFEAGEAKNTYGTGCFLLQHTGTEAKSSRHGLLTTRAASVDASPQFALEGSVFNAGSAVQWARDGLGIADTAAEVSALAEEVDDAGGAVLVPAFTGLGAPHWDPEARGALLGITRGTDRRHVARAVIESIAFQSTELVHAMEQDSGIRIPVLRVDGGATASRALMRFQADLLQRPVARPALLETTALGAGMLAGIGQGLWRLDDLRRPDDEAVFSPSMDPADAAARMAQWRAAVAATRAYRSA